MKLNTQLEAIEALIKQEDVTVLEVSKSGVYWHLYHMLRVVVGIIKSLQKSNPADYAYRFNISRFYVQFTGRIPRGIGKAPKVTTTDEPISEADLTKLLQLAKAMVKLLEEIPAKAHFKHPYFGIMHKRHAISFITLHTQHHLKIVRDIKTKARRNKIN